MRSLAVLILLAWTFCAFQQDPATAPARRPAVGDGIYSSSVFRRRKTITPRNTAANAAQMIRTIFESIFFLLGYFDEPAACRVS